MIALVIYLALFVPAVCATTRLRTLRGAKAGYRRFMFGLFSALFALGFLIAPVAALGLLLLAGVAVNDTAQELRFRHRTVQFERGNIPVRPVR